MSEAPLSTLVIFVLDGVLLDFPLHGEALEEKCATFAIQDEQELHAAAGAKLRPGARELLERLASHPLALYSTYHEKAVLAALKTVGISPKTFFAIKARKGCSSIKPSADPVLEILEALPKQRGLPERIFLLGDHPADIASLILAEKALSEKKSASSVTSDFVPLGLFRGEPSPGTRIGELERAGAWFIVADLIEAAEIILAEPRRDISLSFIFLAYNEEDSIGLAVKEASRFAKLFLGQHEIIVIDDGSTDRTGEKALEASSGEARIVRHPKNLGMGAGIRSGYRAAQMDYVVHLPADRQVRPQSLIRFLPHVAGDRITLSAYLSPPSGEWRKWLSVIFRLIVRLVGGIRVDFAGTFIFRRRLLDHCPWPLLASDSFHFTFELLEWFRSSGLELTRVMIRPFPRLVGTSREAVFKRMLKVFSEVVAYRYRSVRWKIEVISNLFSESSPHHN